MSLPVNTKPQGQPSIRSFFAPKGPSYVAPPSSTTITSNTTAPPRPTTSNTAQTHAVPPPAPHTFLTRRPASLHPQASILPIEPEHIPALRRVTSLILPINYPDSFYAQLSNPATSGAFSRVILWTEPNSTPKVIGGLVCRPEALPFRTPAGNQVSGLYIQSLVLLSPYRSLGLAAACLEDVVASVIASTNNPSSSWKCETVWAHVWVQNDEGLGWYQRRGFSIAGEIKNYYFKLQPGHAYVVERPIIIDRQPSAAAAMSYGNDNDNNHIISSNAKSIPPSTTAMAANLPMYAMPPAGAAQKPTSIPPPPPPSSSSHSNGTTRPPPPPSSAASLSSTAQSLAPPPQTPTGTSFQNLRPETEWNDLPPDMQVPASANGGSRSGASSRSSSSVAASRKKRDRAYPAAAFGGK
ncbi:uncharacterized protein B0I36DRAFT_313792 [Microdochium trichocladiopsis]|uniref:N-acetyltransferase domain-containing protein n=1 Tax=Microdochium trichocladiopsis TaxID=1682393 RepID=A0A9P8YEB9_9PEZI|nr:uncharacterized protein B0I36DRAFT_313792 [Microdochium trichocladiopsis]KAH7037322.1 hypothetical protein B0I36DRAFT_313792 [Microdochium trichocladiopsis]